VTVEVGKLYDYASGTTDRELNGSVRDQRLIGEDLKGSYRGN
jgi:hypothetical protein